MQSTTLQVSLIIGVIIFFGIIIFFLKKNTLSLKYTLLWLFSGLAMLIISVFPGILAFFSDMLGFQVASNALFAMVLGFVLMILLSLTSIVSKQTERIKILVQVNALLEKRIRELEEKIK